jgi:hypothetical protein
MIQQTFSISHDEIARGEYFSHANEPALTLNSSRSSIYVNAASLKRLPNMEYALLVISSSEKRLSVFPCGSGERHAVRLRSGGQDNNKPRYVRCHSDFLDKMLTLMGWKNDCRYRMIGYEANDGNHTIIAFDLMSAEVFLPSERVATVPARHNGQFGAPFETVRRDPLVRIVGQDIETSVEGSEAMPNYGN